MKNKVTNKTIEAVRERERESNSLVKIGFVCSAKNKVNRNINIGMGHMKKVMKIFQKDLSFLCALKELRVKDIYA